MDADQTTRIEIDFSQTAVDGHGDTFAISPNQWNTSDVYVSSSTGPMHNPFTSTNGSCTFQDLSIAKLTPSSKIELRGEDADIEINGESVISMLREIRDRLNILQVSAEMEAEWDELRSLREQYEAKLTECREKSRAWKALKQAS